MMECPACYGDGIYEEGERIVPCPECYPRQYAQAQTNRRSYHSPLSQSVYDDALMTVLDKVFPHKEESI